MRAPSMPPALQPDGQEARQLTATSGAVGLLSWSYKRVMNWDLGRLLRGNPLINQGPPSCAGTGAVLLPATCYGCHGPWLTPAASMMAADVLPRGRFPVTAAAVRLGGQQVALTVSHLCAR